MRIKVSGLLLVAVLQFLCIEAQAAEPVGKTIRAAPTVRASGGGGSRSLSTGDQIYFRDRITTSGGGSGEFQFTDGTKLAVSPSASITIDQSVFSGGSRFKKLGLSAAKGSFRWISGSSSSSAYKIGTPTGVMAIRGTALDITVRGGRTHVLLIRGRAQYCSGSRCQSLNRACDYVVASRGNVSRTEQVSSAFSQRSQAAAIFPFQAQPGRLSSRLRVGGNCLTRTFIRSEQPTRKQTRPAAAPAKSKA